MSIEEYKAFVDGFVPLDGGVIEDWVRGPGFPVSPENRARNELLASLSQQQREVVAGIVAQARSGGIHDTLALLNERLAAGELQLTSHGSALPVEPFGTELHWDWHCRCSGDEWPNEDQG